MPEIVIAEFMDEAAVERMRRRHDTLYDATLVDRPDALAAALAEARVLVVRNRTQARGALLAAAPRLEMVGRLGVGLDNIDLAACAARAIAVVPATGANDLSVAEYVITTAMTLLRGAYAASGDVAAGAWPRQTLIGRELSGRTIGLIGYGAIAREVAARARALGMAVVAHDPLLATVDVVSLHVPLTATTRHMIGATELARMKDDAILVNAARGGVVDEAALATALRAGRIGGAALDVFEVEPLTAEAGKKFVGLPNLILTPHIAGVTVESNIRVSGVIADAVLAHLEAR